MRELPAFSTNDFDADLIQRAIARPVDEPWIDSLAHAAGPDRGLVYDARGIRRVVEIERLVTQ